MRKQGIKHVVVNYHEKTIELSIDIGNRRVTVKLPYKEVWVHQND